MPIEAFLVPIINKVVGIAFGEGIDAAKTSFETRNLRRLMRDRLLREARLNDELMQYEQLSESERVSLMTTEALDFIMSQPLPLDIFFDVNMEPDLKVFREAKNDKHTAWASTIKSERDLVERWWHRVRLAQVRQTVGMSPGDFDYLRLLCRALHSTLKEHD
jgi:hypothetical protein